jgi:hypothetical protein
MVDLVIVSLVHQTPEMVYWMAENLHLYVRGSFRWVVHYNGARPLDRSRLPDWVWPIPDPIQTQAWTPSIVFAVAKCIAYAASKTTFTNVLTMSSGSAFFRPYVVPTAEEVRFLTYEPLFNGSRPLPHLEPFSVDRLGHIAEELQAQGAGTWQYPGFDSHTELHDRIRARGFKWVRGSQWSGQVIPRVPALQIAEDTLPTGPSYVGEEIVLSTYSYNYAVAQRRPVAASEAIINWESGYIVDHIETIQGYRAACRAFPGMGHLVCKVPDDPLHPVRVYLNTHLA